jgi:hypothetical protein
MVAHLVSGLLNRPLLAAPADPATSTFAALDSAYGYERAELARLKAVFIAQGLRLKPLVRALIASPLFRASGAMHVDRLELTGLGGGTLVTPEDLDRRIEAVTGQPWTLIMPGPSFDQSGPRYLRRTALLKLPYGGTNQQTDGPKVRQTQPSSMTAAVITRMGLMVSCVATARDFDRPAADRRLFPLVDPSVVPTGDPTLESQAPILRNIAYLHERVLGERLALNDPEVLATYQLLTQTRNGLAASGESATLNRPCANDFDLVSGALKVPAGRVADPQFTVRAWQAVVAYLLMDYRFIAEQ